MTTLCKGKHCPVRKQCSRYTTGLDEKSVGSDDRYILQCRNQRLFTKEDLSQSSGILGVSQETADNLYAALEAFLNFGCPTTQFTDIFNEHMRLDMVDMYLSIANKFVDASLKASTKSVFTRWWWKRKAEKLSLELDGIMDAIKFLSEKGGEQ